MAQGFVQVPADSVGKKIDTWITTTAGQHRQAVVIGDPSTDANVVSIPSTGRLPIQSENQLDYDTGAGSNSQSIVGIALPSNGGPVAGGTSSNPVRTDPTGTTTQPVSLASSPLPTGAATEASLSSAKTDLDSILTVEGATTDAAVVGDNNGSISAKLRGLTKILNDVWSSASHYLSVNVANASIAVTGTFWQATQPISAASLPLPTGASTSANQSTANTSLSSIDGKLSVPTSIVNGKKTVTTAGTRVTLAGSTAVKSVTIKALNANTGRIFVGNSTVASTNGLELYPGETTSLDIADLATVNLDSEVNGEGVTYLGVA